MMERIFNKSRNDRTELTPEREKEIDKKIALLEKAQKEGKFTREWLESGGESDTDSILLR